MDQLVERIARASLGLKVGVVAGILVVLTALNYFVASIPWGPSISEVERKIADYVSQGGNLIVGRFEQSRLNNTGDGVELLFLKHHIGQLGRFVVLLALLIFLSQAGSQIREFLKRAVNALNGLAESCTKAVTDARLEPAGKYQAFIAVLRRDAQDSLAALERITRAGQDPYATLHFDDRLTLSLVCEEEATYRQGTDTRTESQQVVAQELFRLENFEIPPGVPFDHEFAFRVPPSAMHSFKSSHNRVHWTLLVESEMNGWPDFKRAFPVIVYPNAGDGKP